MASCINDAGLADDELFCGGFGRGNDRNLTLDKVRDFGFNSSSISFFSHYLCFFVFFFLL